MNATTDIAEAVNVLAGRGIVVSVSPTGRLQVQPASLLTADEREWCRAQAGAILAHLAPRVVPTGNPTLTGNEPWDRQIALGLLADADALIERLGVDGRHPTVRDAAAMVASAFATRDLETVRFAVSEFAALVRRLARVCVRTGATGQNRTNAGVNPPTLSEPVQKPKSDGSVLGRAS
jgi:hypothetical protein